jgi:hypothetical protein
MKTLASILALVTIFVSVGCDRPGRSVTGSREDPVLNVRVPGDSARPGTILMVKVSGGTITEAKMAATLGGVGLMLARMDDTTLVGIAPEVAAGSRALLVQVPGRKAQTTVNVRAGESIADPVAAVNAELDAQVRNIPTAAPDGFTAAEWGRYRITLDSLVRDAKTKMAAASPAEQLAVARLMASARAQLAASHASAVFSLAGNTQAAGFPDKRCLEAIGKFARAGAETILWLGVTFGGVVSSTFGVGLAISAGGTVMLFASLPASIEASAGLSKGCFKQQAVSFTELSTTGLLGPPAMALGSAGGTADLTLVSGVEFPIYPTETVRPFSGADAQNPAFSKLAVLVESIHNMVALLPDAIKNRIPGLPRRLADFPSAPPVTRRLAPTLVRLANVQPGTVSLSASASGDALLLKGSSDSAGDVPFTFELVSTSDSTVRRRVSANLQVARTYAGPVRFSTASTSANLTGQTCTWKGTAEGTLSIRLSSSNGGTAVVARLTATETGPDGTATPVGSVGCRAFTFRYSPTFRGTLTGNSFSLKNGDFTITGALAGAAQDSVRGTIGFSFDRPANDTIGRRTGAGSGSYVAVRSAAQASLSTARSAAVTSAHESGMVPATPYSDPRQ